MVKKKSTSKDTKRVVRRRGPRAPRGSTSPDPLLDHCVRTRSTRPLFTEDVISLIHKVAEERKQLEEFLNNLTTEEELEKAVEWETKIRGKENAVGIMAIIAIT